MPLVSRFKAGARVRLNLPGSKLHGITGTIHSPRPPAGWWLIEADRDLEHEPTEQLTGTWIDRSFVAPDLWLIELPPSSPRAGVDLAPDLAPPAPELPPSSLAPEPGLAPSSLRKRRRA